MGEKQQGEKKSEAITVVLMFDMHCEGCAKKVRKSVKSFPGVENVKTDCSTNKLMVTGNVDPMKIKEKVEEKAKKMVQLVSPQPNKAAKEGGGGGGRGGGEKKPNGKKPEEKKMSDDKKPEGKKKTEGKSDEKNSEDKKEKPKEPPVATVQLKTRVHCDGCAHKIKKIVSKCEGVQDANVDLQKDLIIIKGTMDIKKILPYLNVKLKRTVDLVPTKNDDGAGGHKKPKEGGGGGGSAEKPKEGGGSSEKPKGSEGEKKKEGAGDKKDGGGDKKNGGSDKKDDGGNNKKDGGNGGGEGSTSKDNVTRFEVNKMEYNPYSYNYGYAQVYDPRQQGGGYGHQVVEYWHAPYDSQPPQMFSDENPNACSIM